jgi:hypothetical protein
MKNPFRRDFGAELASSKTELSAARTKLVELEREKVEALGQAAAPIADLRSIDRRVDEQKAAITLYCDRIARLRVLARRAEIERRTAARDKALREVIQPQFAEIEELAAHLERAVAALSTAYATLDAATKKLNSTWPSAVPKPRYWFGAFSLLDIRDRLRRAMEFRSIERFAEFTNFDREHSIAAQVKRQLGASLDELLKVEIVVPREPDAEDDAPAAIAEEPARGFAALATVG